MTAIPTNLQRRATFLVVIGVCCMGWVGCSEAADAAYAVSLEAARQEQQSGRAILIDIREPDEHAGGVAPGARLLPMKQLARRVAEIPNDPAQPVLLICRTQNRSSAIARLLREQGFGNVRFVNGGMSEWARRGWPMSSPSARSSP